MAEVWNHPQAFSFMPGADAGCYPGSQEELSTEVSLHASPCGLGFLTAWQPQVGQQFYMGVQGLKGRCPSGQGRKCNVSFHLASGITQSFLVHSISQKQVIATSNKIPQPSIHFPCYKIDIRTRKKKLSEWDFNCFQFAGAWWWLKWRLEQYTAGD